MKIVLNNVCLDPMDYSFYDFYISELDALFSLFISPSGNRKAG